MYQFKTRDSEIKRHRFCLGNIPGNFSTNNMEKTSLNGSVYHFSVDYMTFDTSIIMDIHTNLVKEHDIKQFLG